MIGNEETDPEIQINPSENIVILRRALANQEQGGDNEQRHVIHVFKVNPQTGRFSLVGWCRNGCVASVEYIINALGRSTCS